MKNLPLALIAGLSFIWFGLLAGISFIEAPLKFQAPGVTSLIGVGIGNLVFHALNKLEIILFLVVLACNFFATRKKLNLLIIVLTGLIVAAQTAYLLPKLDLRIYAIQQGIEVQSSSLHLYYVGGEIVKMLLLFTLGLRVLISLTMKDTISDY